MTVRVGINGFGRIGRGYLRALLDRTTSPDAPGIEVVAINDIAPVATLAHLLEHDSTYGRLRHPVVHDDRSSSPRSPEHSTASRCACRSKTAPSPT